MLVLSRRREETIVIDGDIEIVVLQVGHEGVKLGVKAPRHVAVLRGEIYEQVASQNRAAVQAAAPDEGFLARLRKTQEAKKVATPTRR